MKQEKVKLTYTVTYILPYSDKRKQVTNHPNLRKWCLKIGLSMLYFQSEFWAQTLILLKDFQVKTSWYCIDVNVRAWHIFLIDEKCHCQELLPFVKVGQYKHTTCVVITLFQLMIWLFRYQLPIHVCDIIHLFDALKTSNLHSEFHEWNVYFALKIMWLINIEFWICKYSFCT